MMLEDFQDDEETLEMLKMKQELLQMCREHGMEAVFETVFNALQR